MRVLVTGAGGFVGSAVVRALLAAGHEPVAMAHAARAAHADEHRIPEGVEIRSADLRDPESLTAAVAGTRAVCHLAGLTRARESWDRPLDYFAVNVGGTGEPLRAMEKADIDQLVFASTGAVYGTPRRQPMPEELPTAPPHPYASSKLAAEALLEWKSRRRGLKVAVLRLFNAAGGNDPDPTRIVPRVLAAARGESGPFGVNGDGSVVRDYLHVDDAAAAFVAALVHLPPAGEVRRYNIGSGTGASIAEVNCRRGADNRPGGSGGPQPIGRGAVAAGLRSNPRGDRPSLDASSLRSGHHPARRVDRLQRPAGLSARGPG